MNKFILTTAAVLLTSSAWAESTPEKSGINSSSDVAPSTQDFVTEAAASDIFEIESSKLALDRSDKATQTFAQKMIADHEKTSAELRNFVSDGTINVILPPTMSDAQKDVYNNLKSMRGPEFLKQYHSVQVDAHKKAVDLFKRYREKGDQPVLKSWAVTTLPHLQHHLDMANKLNK